MIDSLLRLQYSATDPVAATAAMRAVLGSAEVACRAGGLSWQQVSLVDDGVTVSSIRSSGDSVRVSIRGASELLVILLVSGHLQLLTGGEQLELAPNDLALVPIGGTAELRWSAADLQLFSIPPAPIARLLGVPRTAVKLHAPRTRPSSPALAEYLRHTARLLTSGVFGIPDVYAKDLIRAHAIDGLMAVVVEAFELTNRSEDASDRDGTVIRRAVAEMRAHLIEPLTIPEVAVTAGVSVRGLQMAFQRQLGVSPLLHLRQLRLEAARSFLVDEALAGTTVADVARRFGYANSGRFSTHYRNAYDESPAATIQRIRGTSTPGTRADATAPAESDLIEPERRFQGERSAPLVTDGEARPASPAGT